ncbi:hypothetical protein ABZ746_37595 [Streptomyces sp. NPDC020096]
MIQSLGSFTATAKYSHSYTAFDVHADGERTPVARMYKDSAYDSPDRYSVYGGPRLDKLEGFVNPFKAMLPGHSEIGTVNRRSRSLHHDEWKFTQKDLPELRGAPTGLNSALRHSFPLNVVSGNRFADAAFSLRLRFHAPESEGFELIRLAGARARYGVKVYDDRVNRLLVLSCVAHLNTYVATDPRQVIVDLTFNPFN